MHISFASVVWPAWLFSQTNFYVSLKGNDANRKHRSNHLHQLTRHVGSAVKHPGR